jgi:hypothetical protein
MRPVDSDDYSSLHLICFGKAMHCPFMQQHRTKDMYILTFHLIKMHFPMKMYVFFNHCFRIMFKPVGEYYNHKDDFFSPTTTGLLEKKLMLGYRRPKNLRDTLVRANLPYKGGDEDARPKDFPPLNRVMKSEALPSSIQPDSKEKGPLISFTKIN